MRRLVAAGRLSALLLSVAASAALLVPAPAGAQKRCTKGIPCGNTCISATKTCRIGSGTARPATAPRSQAATTPIDEPSLSEKPWVASSRGKVYYLRGCATAAKLAPVNRIYFKSAEEAEAAGYRRSRSSSC